MYPVGWEVRNNQLKLDRMSYVSLKFMIALQKRPVFQIIHIFYYIFDSEVTDNDLRNIQWAFPVHQKFTYLLYLFTN